MNILDTVHFSVPPNMRSTSVTYKDIYEALILFSESFRNLYNFLDNNQNPKLMPNIDKKPRGVLSIYLGKMPESLWGLFYAHMHQDKWLVEKFAKFPSNYDKLNHFINEFERRAREYKSIYDSYKPIEDIVTRFPSEYEVLKSKRQATQLHKLTDGAEYDETKLANAELNKLENVYSPVQKTAYRPPDSMPRISAAPTVIRPCFVKFQNGDCRIPNCPHDHSDMAMKTLRDKGNSLWAKLVVLDEISVEDMNQADSDIANPASPDSLNMLREIEPSELDAIRDALSILTTGPIGSPIVFGKIILSAEHSWDVSDILLDTGALQRNYIDPDVLDDITIKLNDSRQFQLVPKLNNINAAVELGDASTVRRISQSVFLTIAIPDANGFISIAREELQVFKTGHPIIIGRPAICRSFMKPLIDGLTGKFFEIQRPDNLRTCPRNLLTLNPRAEVETSSISGELLSPFENAIEEAPEELNLDHPQSFSFATDFLDRDMNEMVKEYRRKVEARISIGFKNHPDLRHLLDDKGPLVFVPQNWRGLQGVASIDIQLVAEAPSVVQPKSRFIPRNKMAIAMQEFDRMRKYFYEPSTSPIASPIVVAPKASDPFVRICGDYREINKYILRHYGFIPRIFDEISKIIGFSLFTGLDMKNSFHQCPITEATSDLLSIVTPWGQFRPKFLPEGVSVASITLQDIMREIFKNDVEKGINFPDFVIVIFDNLLILGHDETDMLIKIEQVFDKCIEHNMFLNVNKSDFCVTEIDFFGYICSKNSYRLNEAKFESIRTLVMPSDLKAMRSFLGTAVFFQPFVPNFVDHAAPFYDTTRKEVKWPLDDAWVQTLLPKFANFINALLNALKLFYPDYS